MPNIVTLFQVVAATASLVLGGGVGPVLVGGPSVPAGSTAAGGSTLSLYTANVLRAASDDLVLSSDHGDLVRGLAAEVQPAYPSASVSGGDATGVTWLQFAQTDSDPLDGPVQRLDDPEDDLEAEEPLDAPLEDDESILDEEPLDASLVANDPLDEDLAEVPETDELDEEPVAEAEPLDAPLEDEVVDQLEPEAEILDAPLPAEEVAVAPVAETLAAAPVAAPVAKTAPVSDKGKPVTSVRKKGGPQDQVVVVAGRRPLPSTLASCDVAVGSGRATVGVDCDGAPVVAAHQPAIPRVPGSAALISTENPSLITSRRDGIQIGEYPDPTLGDSIATTVRAAIFPEDVIVPDVLIVPGEVVVAGNASREDPIVVWRSELEQAALETGMPVEMLATVIRVTSDGDPAAESPVGGVGLMHVPIRELVARGISEDQWIDPATNIRIGAQLMAAGVAPSDVHSGAAVAQYLADSCGSSPSCVQPPASQVSEWIVYYRLRTTTHPAVVATQPDAATEASGWPFEDEVDEPATEPLARLRGDDERDADRQRRSPTERADQSEDEPDWDWPWTPATEE